MKTLRRDDQWTANLMLGNFDTQSQILKLINVHISHEPKLPQHLHSTGRNTLIPPFELKSAQTFMRRKQPDLVPVKEVKLLQHLHSTSG